MNEIEQDKKFANKVITKGGVERDVFIKRYEKYIWGIINAKFSGDNLPAFLKNDLYHYIIIKIFDNDCDALKKYIQNYPIPLKSFLSFFVGSRITDFIRKEVKEQNREISIENFKTEDNQEFEVEDSSLISADNILELQDINHFFDRFSKDLDKKNHHIFRLIVEGLSSKEISIELGLELKEVYRCVFQIKKDLKLALKEEYK